MKETIVAVVEQKSNELAPAEEEKALSQSVSEVEKMAASIIINSEEDYKRAAEFGRMLKQRNAEVTEFFAPMKKSAHEATRISVTGKRQCWILSKRQKQQSRAS